MAKFINPFTDMGFKRIFGQEINKDLLIDFLNALLKGERRVKDIRFLDKELLPEYENDRSLIYDIYCTDENGEQFIVEMQNREHVNFRERTLYYLSQAIARQGEKGTGWQFDLKAVYGVFFLNFRLSDLWVTFNVKETLLPGLRIGTRMNGYVPALDSDVEFEVTYISPQADFATWSATRTQGGFDIRTFAIKAKAVTEAANMRPGMSVLVDWDQIGK